MSRQYVTVCGALVPEGYRIVSGPHRGRDILTKAETVMVVWDSSGQVDLFTDIIIARRSVTGLVTLPTGRKRRASMTRMDSSDPLFCTIYELGLDSTVRHKSEQRMLDQFMGDIADALRRKR